MPDYVQQIAGEFVPIFPPCGIALGSTGIALGLAAYGLFKRWKFSSIISSINTFSISLKENEIRQQGGAQVDNLCLVFERTISEWSGEAQWVNLL